MRRFLILLTLAITACAVAAEAPRRVGPTEAAALIEDGVQLLDIRTEKEWNQGRIAGARRVEIGTGEFAERVTAEFDLSKPILVYCRSANRTVRGVRQLRRLGFGTIYELKGGILAWEGEGREVVK